MHTNRHHTPARRASAHSTAMMALIVLIVLTIGFGLIGYFNLQNSYDFMNGVEGYAGEDPIINDPLKPRIVERDNLRERIETLRANIAQRRDYLHLISVKMADEGAYLSPTTEDWITGSPEEDSRRLWAITQESALSTFNRIKSWREGFYAHEGMHETPWFGGVRELLEAGEMDVRRDNWDMDSIQGRSYEVEIRGADAVRNATAESDAEVRRKEGELLDEIAAIEDETRDSERAHQDRLAELQTQRGQLEARIRELLDLRLNFMTEISPDGQIMRLTPDRRSVMIDIGATDNVMRGLKLEVFRYDRGRMVTKGMVEVIEVEQHWATCRMIEEIDQKDEPIAQGDYVGNPVFHTTEPKIFVLAGEFKRYNKGDLEAFIRAAGGIVEQELTSSTNYLVTGEYSDGVQEAARQYHLLAITEDQLVRYLQPNFERSDQ